MQPFNMLALLQAGHIKEDDDTLAIIQNIEPEHAHQICKWLVLATRKPATLRLMSIGAVEDIHYTPEQVEASLRIANQHPDHSTKET